MTGASVATVTQLPNTGTGATEATATLGSTGLAALLGGGALALAGAAVTAQRRKA